MEEGRGGRRGGGVSDGADSKSASGRDIWEDKVPVLGH